MRCDAWIWALLAQAERHGPLRRVEVEPDDVADLGHEQRILGQVPRILLARSQSESSPDPRDHRLTQPQMLGHRPRRPVCRIGRSGLQRRSYLRLDLLITHHPRPARSRLIEQAIATLLDKPVAPLGDRVSIQLQPIGNLGLEFADTVVDAGVLAVPQLQSGDLTREGTRLGVGDERGDTYRVGVGEPQLRPRGGGVPCAESGGSPRAPVGVGQRGSELRRQARAVGEFAQHAHPGMRNDTMAVGGYFHPRVLPRHSSLAKCLPIGLFEPREVQFSIVGQALSLTCTPSRETFHEKFRASRSPRSGRKI